MSEVRRWAHTVTWEGLQISAAYMAINDGGEYVMHADYVALETECKILRNSLAGSNNQARANKLEAEKFAIDWFKVLEERDALAGELAAIKGREAVGVVHLRKGGGISMLQVELNTPLHPGTKLYTLPATPEGGEA